MTSKLEDTLGKLLMIGVFSYMTAKQIVTISLLISVPWAFDGWLLTVISRSASFAFLVLVLWLTVTRLPPKDSAEGIEPRVSAILGTFALMALIVLPTGSAEPTLLLMATLMIVAGTLASIYCLYYLGRSFSIMATARELVKHGPYGVVRHPLYVAEAITVLGIIIANWSAAAVVVGIIQFAFQFRRMQNEERILRSVFPEYEDYGKTVPMFVPFLRPKNRIEIRVED